MEDDGPLFFTISGSAADSLIPPLFLVAPFFFGYVLSPFPPSCSASSGTCESFFEIFRAVRKESLWSPTPVIFAGNDGVAVLSPFFFSPNSSPPTPAGPSVFFLCPPSMNTRARKTLPLVSGRPEHLGPRLGPFFHAALKSSSPPADGSGVLAGDQSNCVATGCLSLYRPRLRNFLPPKIRPFLSNPLQLCGCFAVVSFRPRGPHFIIARSFFLLLSFF